MNILDFRTPGELGDIIASNLRAQRKRRKISLKRLAEMSGVSYGSLRRFESMGEISLTSLLKVAIVLDCSEQFRQLFSENEPLSIKEIIDGKL